MSSAGNSSSTPSSTNSLLNQMQTFTGDMQSDIGAAKDNLSKTTKIETDEENTNYKGYQNTMGELADGYQKLRKEAADIKPFVPPQKQDPLMSFGSILAGAMGLVSLATRKSMVASLDAGAAAINATKQNNDEEYNKAYDAWKSNTDFAFKQLGWENDQLKTLVGMADTDYANAGAHIKTLAAISNDKALSIAWDKSGIEGAQQLLNARLKIQSDGIANADKLEDLHEKRQKAVLIKQTLSEHPEWSSSEKLAFINGEAGGAASTANKWQVLTDPKNNTQYRYNPETAQSTTLDGKPYTPSGASKIASGTTPRSSAGAYIQKFMQENPDATADDISNAASRYRLGQSEAGTVGTRSGAADVAAKDVEIFATQARDASKALPRTDYAMANDALQKWDMSTSNPQLRQLMIAADALVNSRARAISPTGSPHVNDQLEGRKMLSAAFSSGDFEAAVEQMEKEASGVQAATQQTKNEFDGAGVGFKTNPKWPSATGVKDGKVLLDSSGGVVAKANNGKWGPP